ncbi:MAG: DUF3109 family protein [Ignavibacteriales bacterium]|jgi:hypothetical protein|nr:DUF3109 family protein [Ignavibacteriaceae bacterium]NLH60142.1 DUF3109 family protein [Ignavibacteriales bacterium]HOJ17260.1 DUF3109 family protein [Ignavibacteriaceae bacterium]HPO54449.1 DUF3109 family protein [Ignavibacteriaceae bacterium]
MKTNEKIIKGIKIDPNIFTFKYSCQCNGECCNYGVYADLKEHEFILSIKDRIIPMMDETQSTNIEDWFEEPCEDDDFESGYAVGTEVINGKCAFLDKNGLCVLQKLADLDGVHKWEYKPIYCVLFPLVVFENELTIDTEHIDRLSHCNKHNPNCETTIFEYCTEEIIHLMGEDGFEELKQYRDEVLAGSLNKND